MGGFNVAKHHREDLAQKLDGIVEHLSTYEVTPEQQVAINEAYELKKELKGKRYGLRFEEHRETIDDILDNSVPVLIEEPSLALKNGGELSFLIEGDNLVSLDLLMRTHSGRIDLIYIDPPYNTGAKKERFRYDDDIVDSNDLFRHSKWLSFMDRRLRKARRLLSTKGSIFISINDIEQAPLKMLCDDVFGAECFQGCICWQKTYSPRNDKKGIPAECEYIYVYSRVPEWMPKALARTEEMDSKYKNPDGDAVPWRNSDAFGPNAVTHQGMVYAIQHPFTGELIYPYSSACWRYDQATMLDIMNGWCRYELRDLNDSARRAEVCGIAASDVREGVKGIVLVDSLEESRRRAQIVYEKGPWPRFFFTSGGTGGIARKTYLDQVGGKLPTNYWSYNDVGHTDEAKKELKRIFEGKIPFETPKPTRLMKRIIEIASDEDSIILDFFAGSATLADAVLQYNNEHGGNRRFIIATNNEDNICREVAYERIRRIVEGYSYSGKQKSLVFDQKIQTRHAQKPDSFVQLAAQAEEARSVAEGKHDTAKIKVADGRIQVEVEDVYDSTVDPLPGSLKYFKVGFVPFDDGDTFAIADEVLPHVRELVELENGIDFDSDPTAAIALTDEELDSVVANLDSNCRAVYIGHDVLAPTATLDLLQSKLIQVYEIPEYYYRELEV